jgi:hypothetical protein
MLGKEDQSCKAQGESDSDWWAKLLRQMLRSFTSKQNPSLHSIHNGARFSWLVAPMKSSEPAL